MKKPIKYYLSAGVVAAILIVKMGVIEGSVDYHYIQLAENETAQAAFANAALVSERHILPNKVTPLVHITAYSSRPEETDDTPFITASGTRVRDGVVAANWLPIGTKIKIPALFGDKIFTVEDRMARKNAKKLDIWFAETKEAYKFGVRFARVEILES